MPGAIGQTQVDAVRPGRSDVDGVLHPLGRLEKTDVVAVGVRVRAGFDVHPAVAVGPALVPSGVLTGGVEHVFPPGIRVGMAVHALIVVGGIDRSRDGGDGSQGCGVTVARLGEDRAQDFISGFGVGQADTFGQLGQGVAGRSGTQIGIGAAQIIEEILIAGREGGAGQAVDALELFHRPPRHADPLAAE